MSKTFRTPMKKINKNTFSGPTETVSKEKNHTLSVITEPKQDKIYAFSAIFQQ
jgi:hypothetical protein